MRLLSLIVFRLRHAPFVSLAALTLSNAPLVAQWDNLAITKAANFVAPQPSGSAATLRPLLTAALDNALPKEVKR